MAENINLTVPQESSPNASAENKGKKYLRWDLAKRIEHWIFMLSFTALGLTGLVQKYAEAPLSISIVAGLGGIENTRTIHHWAATIMMLVTIYHLGAVAYRMYVRRVRLTMLPTMEDIRAAIQSMGYNLGLLKHSAQQGRYTFEEKLEYWAVVWGTIVMAVTGYMMWNPIATARFLPGEFIPAAKAAHGGEALLAVLSIALWHLYHVIVKHFNRSMFTGYLSEEEMLHEHPLELADIKAGIANRPIDPEAYKRRMRIFVPSYSVIAVALLVGVYFFVNYEETAITTVPPAEQVVVFAPLTPTPLPSPVPTRTSPPGGLASWQGGIGDLLNQRCGICHNSTGKLGGLDLTSYQAALETGSSGPAVIPGDPDNSPLIVKQAQGGHPEQLSEELLDQLRDWIANGAPES
ncbi:MAG: cytochrome b/b6 domain-containing protein [Anaerolineales bacterium]|nr:MAG: cytochrome b/b6 domain-containing protein [Anaerolineales bacterium]